MELVPLKSNRVESSRDAWSTALRTSWASTSETTSKLAMASFLPLNGRLAPATAGVVRSPTRRPEPLLFVTKRSLFRQDGSAGWPVRRRGPAEPPDRVLYDGSPVLTGVVRWMQEGVVLHDRRRPHRRGLAVGLRAARRAPRTTCIGISDPDVFGDEPTQAGWRMIDLDGGLFPPEQNPAAITARTGEPASAVMGVHRPDGSRVWLSVSSVPLPVEGDDRPMVLATFVDITDRVEARNRLAESEERFRLTLQHAPIGMATVDLDGTYLSVNPRLAEMLGRRPEELVGHDLRRGHPPRRPRGRPEPLASSCWRAASTASSSTSASSPATAPSCGATWRWPWCATPRASPLHFVSQVEDITESQAHQGAARGAGALRPPHRSGQPGPHRRPHPPGRRPGSAAAAGRWPCCAAASTGSSG